MAGEGVSFRRHPQVSNSAEAVSSDTTGLAHRVIGFMADAAGTARIRLRADNSYIDLPVAANTFYPLDVEAFNLTGSTTVTTIWVFRQN